MPEQNSAFAQAIVVEDQADTRAWLSRALAEAFGQIETRAFASLTPAQDWLRTQDGSRQTVALIDLVLPDGSGVTLIREMADLHPAITPVVVSIYDDDTHLFDAIAAGAQGYLLKDERPEAIVRSLRQIEGGEPPLSPSIARRMLAYFHNRSTAAVTEGRPDGLLTTREKEVLGLLGKGLRLADAARQLGLTRHTVAGYVKVIYSKLNISSRAEAALEAMKRGLI